MKVAFLNKAFRIAVEKELLKANVNKYSTSKAPKGRSSKADSSISHKAKPIKPIRKYKPKPKSKQKNRIVHEEDAVCGFCGEQFETVPERLAHLQLHDRSRKFCCPNCNFCFNKRQEMQRHLREYHQFRCHVCNTTVCYFYLLLILTFSQKIRQK